MGWRILFARGQVMVYGSRTAVLIRPVFAGLPRLAQGFALVFGQGAFG